MSDDPEVLTKEKKNLVKRTKSFWKFGKNSSDNEILEGMALWKHRDLVDVNDGKSKTRRKINSQDRVRRPSRDKSNDSDRTINNNNINSKEHQNEKRKEIKPKEIRHSKSFHDKPRQNGVSKKSPKPDRKEFETAYKKSEKSSNFDDQFYDDDGDGLMMKTVNRKNILQQYSDDISGTDSEAESNITSDDPYDCILVDDQKVKKSDNHFPNVAELGKKLEKLSKTSKYSPNKENNVNNQVRNTVQEKNNINMRLERHNSVKVSPEMDNQDIMMFQDKRHMNSFKTFGIEVQNNENGEKETIEDQKYYSQSHKRNDDATAQEKRRYYAESNSRNNSMDKRGRPSYESIDSDTDHRNRENKPMTNNRRTHVEVEKREKLKYYDSTNDELSDVVENRKFLPRTKLTKTNSNNSSHSKYEQDIGLMEYGETLQRRLKNPEYNSKFDEKSPHNGNMYGPWYDLWGLDSTGTSPRK